MRSMSRITGLLAAAALACIGIAASGCSNTKAAYDAADTLEERAYVVTEHYTAIVKQAADLKDRGVLAGDALAKAREVQAVASPAILKLQPLVVAYNAAQSADTEVALQKALDDAVLAVADLLRIVKAATGGAT